ncbi:THO complex subunit 4B isoform X2 [Manihot esculenta]|uniref:RRM domain-containing protein n=1 Tax=Manihot esculenta TaxID=3983 RepID=A0A2C9VKG4_MANES|nr:THO complex subunit 4B isoform X2 [Manihot esculenta]OAY46060.1 hypothetical protein MANES_07G113400v8 [Manihot esculenta]
MSSSLDMSLDDIICKNRGYGGCGGGGGGRVRNNNHFRGGGGDGGRAARSVSAPGPYRRFFQGEPIRHGPYPVQRPMVVPEPIMLPSGGAIGESGTKLYISDLDYGVSNEDIKFLFSDVGELKRYSIHYDKSGRSKGTAEVVFARKADALAAIKRYNNVHLDGKPMKIELVGLNLFAPPTPVAASSNMGNLHGPFRSGQESFRVRGWGLGSVRGRGYTRYQGQERRHGEELTADELDADLERYHFEAMQIR